ncbi:SIS domain-containing protein [bacterium]|nr:SIS domain-containing protein [bacterium]MCI0617075.1 SIS domain-containing protein [bacterium]
MSDAENFIRSAVESSLELKREFFNKNMENMLRVYELLKEVRNQKRKILIFGNGGSAADAQHFAAELMHRVENSPIGMRAHALHTDTSLLTAISNDEGFDSIFAKQIETLADPSDLTIAISTSGNSTNIVEGLKMARDKRCRTVGLLGRDGGRAMLLCDAALVVPHRSTPRIQEVHGMIIHLLCQLLELNH